MTRSRNSRERDLASAGLRKLGEALRLAGRRHHPRARLPNGRLRAFVVTGDEVLAEESSKRLPPARETMFGKSSPKGYARSHRAQP